MSPMVSYVHNFFQDYARESAYHLTLAADPSHPLKGRATHAGLAIILFIPVVKQIAQRFFRSFYQFYTLQAKLYHWSKETTKQSFMRGRLDAEKIILKCYCKQQNELNLIGVDLTSLPDVFDVFHPLQRVILNNELDRLKDVPESFFSLKVEQYCSIIGNNRMIKNKAGDRFKVYEGSYQDNSKLEKFYNSLDRWISAQNGKNVKNCAIARARIEDCYYFQKTELDLSDLGLTDLPDIFRDLPFLEKLMLENNRLRNLPNSFFTLKMSQYCSLLDNCFDEATILEIRLKVGGNFKIYISNDRKRESLKRFYSYLDGWISWEDSPDITIRKNARREIEYCYYRQKEMLSFNGWGLINLPDLFNDLSHLKRLDISLNHLTYLPSSLFFKKALPQLEELDISFNPLEGETLTPLQDALRSSEKLPNLKHLKISLDQLKYFQKTSFSNLRCVDVVSNDGTQSFHMRNFASLYRLIEETRSAVPSRWMATPP